MEIEITLEKYEIEEAITFYLENKFGIYRGGCKLFTTDGEPFNESLLCGNITEIKKPLEIIF